MTVKKSSIIPPVSDTAIGHLRAARALLEKVGKRHMVPGSLGSAKTHFENALVELQAQEIEAKNGK